MKYKIFTIFWMVVLAVCCLGITLSHFYVEEPTFYYSPVRVESYTVGDFDQLQIWKIYQLDPTDDPAHIPTEDFELNGWSYHMLRMDKEDEDGQTTYTVIFNGTKKSKTGGA